VEFCPWLLRALNPLLGKAAHGLLYPGVTKEFVMRFLFALIIPVALAACASKPKVNYPQTANPVEEVQKLQDELDVAMADQYDVVAPKQLEKSQKHLAEARKEFSKRGRLDEFWEEMGYARGYLSQARDMYESRSPKAHDVLKARKEALRSGVRRYEVTSDRLKDLDDHFRSLSGHLEDEKIDGEAWTSLGNSYRQLELDTIEETKLGETRKLIEDAKKRGAARNAPRTLKDAETALRIAESSIAQDPYNEAAYMPAVDRAGRIARMLVAVNATARKASGQSNEAVARELIMRNEAITSLEADLMATQLEADATQRALAGRDAEARGLALSNRALLTEADWNRALEDARGEFDEDEAEVYRQGDKLLIRLKSVQFPSGSAQVPEPSREVLSKVTSVIEELNAKQVEVQGHTDSTGSPAVNKKISNERAKAVASFIEEEIDEESDLNVQAVGYGYERPLVTNKTPKGRAINRRVDVVITPAPASAPEEPVQGPQDE
jgi:OmpA-OmpF porin, OOP family